MTKEAMNLNVSKEGLMGGFGSRGEERQEVIDYYLIISNAIKNYKKNPKFVCVCVTGECLMSFHS